MTNVGLEGIPAFAIEMGLTPFAVGLFIMEWAKHESLVALLIARVERRDATAVRDELLDGQISGYEKGLLRLRGFFDEADREKLDEIVKKHIGLREARHEIVHGFW